MIEKKLLTHLMNPQRGEVKVTGQVVRPWEKCRIKESIYNHLSPLYMSNVTISEFHGPDGYADELILSGTIDEMEAKDYVEDCCNANNCLVNEIKFVGGYFIARVSSDDYK